MGLEVSEEGFITYHNANKTKIKNDNIFNFDSLRFDDVLHIEC